MTCHAARQVRLCRVGSLEPICDVTTDRTIVGGEAWIVTDSGDTIAAAVDVGQGKLVTMVQSSIFTNAYMGGVKSDPNEVQLRISSLEFWLLNRILPKVNHQ